MHDNDEKKVQMVDNLENRFDKNDLLLIFRIIDEGTLILNVGERGSLFENFEHVLFTPVFRENLQSHVDFKISPAIVRVISLYTKLRVKIIFLSLIVDRSLEKYFTLEY